IGVISSLAGIGGGSLSVPFLNRHGIEMKKAIGSSSVCGFAIAISGMIGFILHGYQVENLPQYSLGYVYLPALLAIATTSMLTTRIGAKLATQMPTARLKRFFAIFLMCVAVTMLFQ
ncbi:sulfite exporter TauE/SafE family protein, partial [Klebsiella pneumoniae]